MLDSFLAIVAYIKFMLGLITWRISAWAEISARLLKQILCRLHGEGFSLGHNSGRSNRLENLNKSRVIETEFQPGLKSKLGRVQ